MKSGVANQNKRASLMLLSKEANTKDTQLKFQLLLSFKDNDPSKGSERIWLESGYFGDQKNFSENTLIYVNQGYVSLVKGGGEAIYCDYIVLAQIMPMANIDPAINLDTYTPKDDEVIIYTPMYNTVNGLYYGITKKLGLITLRCDTKEHFFIWLQ